MTPIEAIVGYVVIGIIVGVSLIVFQLHDRRYVRDEDDAFNAFVLGIMGGLFWFATLAVIPLILFGWVVSGIAKAILRRMRKRGN